MYFKSLNVVHFGMIEATGLKMQRRGRLEWHHLPTKCHKIHKSIRKLLRGPKTDRHNGDFISLLSFLESRLETMLSFRTTVFWDFAPCNRPDDGSNKHF
jgi:hypothetical protein